MKKLLWIRTPKCAGTSVSSFFYENYIEHPVALPLDGIYTLKNGTEIGIVIGANVVEFSSRYPDFFEQSFKFAIVRNPYDRFVSGYSYCVKMGWFSGSFSEFFSGFVNDGLCPRSRKHVVPLTRYLTDGGKTNLDYLDLFVRFENLQVEICDLFREYLMLDFELPHENKSSHGPYQEYYTDETREMMAELFAEDIALFGYEFMTATDKREMGL